MGSSPIARSIFMDPETERSSGFSFVEGREPGGRGSGKREFPRSSRGSEGGVSPSSEAVRRPIARSIFTDPEVLRPSGFSFITGRELGGKDSAVPPLPQGARVFDGRLFRSWRFNLFFLFLLTVRPAFPQVATDYSRPFDQGQAILLPGTTAYLGDLPHEIELDVDEPSYRTLAGWLAPRTGWAEPSGSIPAGARTLSPGVFFEGIAFPLSSRKLLDWMPAPAFLEIQDLPASAWWGPSASSGAIQLRAAPGRADVTGDFALWGGSGGRFGLSGYYQDSGILLNALSRYGAPGGERLSLLSKAQWIASDSVRFESGMLASDGVSDDYWNLAYVTFELSSKNFQTLQLRPFLQQAREDGETVTEGGAEARYLFNLAGLADAQVGGGFTASHQGSPGGSGDSRRGFVQAMLLGDALGIVNADLAIRLDLPGTGREQLSAILGLQATQGILTWSGDYEKGVSPVTGNDLHEAGLGVRCQPDEHFNASLKYLFEQGDGGRFDGARLRVEWKIARFLPVVLQGIGGNVEEQFRRDEAGMVHWDTGGKLEGTFLERGRLWVGGRAISERPLFLEAGAAWSFRKGSRIFVTVSNLDNLPLSWPDPDAPTGRTFQGGLEVGF